MNIKKRLRAKFALHRNKILLEKYIWKDKEELGTMECLWLGDKIKKLKTCIENTQKNLDNDKRSNYYDR